MWSTRVSPYSTVLTKSQNPKFGDLTLRSSRTPPALPFALSQLLAIPAPLVASVQAGPLSSFVIYGNGRFMASRPMR